MHCLTQRSADFFGLADRGVIEPGRRGDLAVFALDELETRGLERRYDLPEGRYRLTRAPAGFRAVAVAGELTVSDGDATGALPAQLGSLGGPRYELIGGRAGAVDDGATADDEVVHPCPSPRWFSPKASMGLWSPRPPSHSTI